MQLQQSQSTVVVAANAAELVCAIVQNIAGDAVADTFNGSPLSRAVIHNLALNEIKNNISNQTGVK